MQNKQTDIVWTKRNRSKWHWIALFGAIGIGSITSGIMQNASGIMIVPLAEAFGIGRGPAANYLSVMGYVMAVLYFFSGMIMDRFKSRIWIPLGLAAGTIGMIMPYFAQSYGLLYPASCFMAVTGAFCGGGFMCGLGVNWFSKGSGFIVGVINATTTLAGAVWSVAGSFIIEQAGWRTAFLIEGILLAVFFVLSFALFRYHPQEKGLLPYGAPDTDAENDSRAAVTEIPGVTAKRAAKSACFWLILIFAALTMAVDAMVASIPGLAISQGMDLTQSGFVGTICLAGNVIGALLVGFLFDKIGLFKATTVLSVFGVIGIVLLIWAPNYMAIYIGAFIFGLPLRLAMVGHAVALNAYIGPKNYATIAMWINAVLALSYYFFVGQFSRMYDAAGNYNSGLILCITFLVIAVVLSRLIIITGRKLKQEW